MSAEEFIEELEEGEGANKLSRAGLDKRRIPNLEYRLRQMRESYKDILVALFDNALESGPYRALPEAVNSNLISRDIKDTPDRMARALMEMTKGYYEDPNLYLSLFDNPAKDEDQMVVVNKTHFNSLCEHHLLPFSGYVSIGYIPDDKIIGLSKFSRIIDVFANRLQLQEKLSKQIFDFLLDALKPKELFVRIIGEHDCVSCRGVKQKDSNTITIFKTKGLTFSDINNVIKE